MKIPGKSKSLHKVETDSSGGGPQKDPQYSDFEEVMQNQFGIITNIGVLLSQTSAPTSSSAQEFDRPNA
jgi:hypothetical protein